MIIENSGSSGPVGLPISSNISRCALGAAKQMFGSGNGCSDVSLANSLHLEVGRELARVQVDLTPREPEDLPLRETSTSSSTQAV